MINSVGFSLQRLSGDKVDNPLKLYAVLFAVTAKFRATVWIWVDIKGSIFELIGALFRNMPGIGKTTKLQDSQLPFEIRTGYLQKTCIALPLRRCTEI